MDQHNSASSMDVPIEIEEDDNASVDSEQLMADIDEFISESPETEVVVELYDYEDESESNASGCEVKSMSADEPTSSSGSVVKSFDYQKIQVNQPVVLLSKLDQHEMAKYFTNKENIRGHEIAKHSTSKQNISEGINSKSDCKKSEESSEVKQSVWCDDMDGSLSELSVSDFSLSGSDIEDDNMPTIVKSNSAADSDSKAINVKKSDVSRVDQRRNSKETLAASHATNSKNVQSKSKSPMPSSQSRVSGTSSLNTSKNTVKFKGKPESSAKSMSKSLPCETNSIGMTKCSPKETSFKSTTKSSPSEEIISKHDKNHFQGKQVVEQKENVKKDEEYLKQTECGSSDESNKNWRYELTLTNFNIQELTNESFRKFINLASDCAMYFSPPTASNKPTEGGVSLYFGDFAAIQSAMQKLGQVLFTSTSKLQGQIIGRKMLPLRTVASGSKANSGAKWKIVNHVKMFFTLYTAWAEKLKQLVQVKDWKKADERHEKFAKIQRVPTSVTKQFLSLLFPFSINIHSPNSQNASKKTCAESFYSIDVKYASQDLMETVLGCYQNLSITIPSSLLPLTKLYVSNVKPKAMPPGHKGIRSGAKKPCQHEYAKHGRLFPCKNHPPHRQQLKQHDHSHRYHQHRVVTGQSSPGANKAFVNPHSTTQHKSDSSMSSSTPEQTRDRKRSSSTMEDTRLLGKKSRFNQLEEKTASQPLVISGDSQDEPAVNTSCDMNDVKKMAEAQGLDPNNSDVLCILEMQKQLVSMQSLISLPQPVQQQPTVESDPERSTEEIQIAEAEQKLRESIATGQKQLFEIEEKLKTSKRKIQHSKHDSSVSEAQDYNKPSASVAPPPNLNDQPLDFKKPQPRVELAVKADEMRSKITAVVKKPIATFKKPLPITSRKAPIKAEDCALPLEFGKNVVKVNPKDIQQQSSEGQERGQERSKFGRGANQLQGRGLNTDNRFKNRDGTQKRGKISRWSSVDDRDVSLKDRRGSDGISLQHGIGVTNQQSEIGMKVLGNGLLPTPTESLETSWGRNDAREPDSKSNERRKFSEQGTAKSGRNFMSRDRDSQGREGRANIPQSQNQCRREYFDEDRGDGYQNKRSVDMQDRLPHKRGLSQLSQAGNKGLSIIEKLQKEAFARGKGDDGFKKSSSSDRDLSGAREQFRGGDDRFYQYEEETSWTDHEDSQYGWDNQNKAKMDSAGRGPQSHSQRDRDYSGVKGQRKPFSRRGSESQSVSHLNDEYYGGSADSMFKPNSTDTGARINRGRGNREDERYMEYDGGYQDEGQSSGGVDRLGEMGFGGNRRGQDPGSAKRPKLDNYQSREAGVMDEWNQQEHDGDGRGGPHSFGRDKGGSKGYNVMHKAGRETGSDLCDREKQQNNYYQQGDEYDEGNVWEYGHRGVARGIEMADANRGGKGGNIATRGRGFERHRGGKSDIRGRGGVKRGGFGAAGRGGFQDKGSVGDGYEQSDAFSGGGHRTGAARGRGGHFGKGDYDGILHEDSGHYDDNKRWSFDNDQGDGVEFNDSRDQYSHGDYGRPGNVDAGIGNKQSFSQMERRGFENMKGDSNRGHVGKSFGFDNKGDCGNFGNSDIGHDGNSFGSSDKGGGGNFGSSKRGRGGHNFGGSNSDIGHVSSTYVRSDKDRGGGSFDGNDRGRADDRYGSSDRGRDGGINRGRGGGNFGSSDRGRDGGINRGRDGGINRGRGGGNFGSSDRGRGGNFGSSDRNRGGSDGRFGSRDSGASSFGRIDSNNGRGRSTGNSSRGRGDNNSKVQSSHGGLGLLGAVPTSSYGEIGDEVGRDFAPPMNRGVNFY